MLSSYPLSPQQGMSANLIRLSQYFVKKNSSLSFWTERSAVKNLPNVQLTFEILRFAQNDNHKN